LLNEVRAGWCAGWHGRGRPIRACSAVAGNLAGPWRQLGPAAHLREARCRGEQQHRPLRQGTCS
jgi:hypothetical protein